MSSLVQKVKRISQACIECHQRKIRCSGIIGLTGSCQHCKKAGYICAFKLKRRGRNPKPPVVRKVEEVAYGPTNTYYHSKMDIPLKESEILGSDYSNQFKETITELPLSIDESCPSDSKPVYQRSVWYTYAFRKVEDRYLPPPWCVSMTSPLVQYSEYQTIGQVAQQVKSYSNFGSEKGIKKLCMKNPMDMSSILS